MILEVSNSKKVVAQESPKLKSLIEKRSKLNDERTLNRADKKSLEESLTLTKKFADTAFDRVENQPPKSVQEAREIMETTRLEEGRTIEPVPLSEEYESLRWFPLPTDVQWRMNRDGD